MPEGQQQLSEEDKKILAEAHKNKDNPQHPAHKDHPEVSKFSELPSKYQNSHSQHHDFLKKLASRFGNAAVWGAGATAGSDLINSIFK